MAIRIDYVLKETGTNLVRNLTLTFAAVLTVAVSLAMVAASYLIGAGIENSFLGLRSDVDLFVYMNPTATAEVVFTAETVDARRSRSPTSTTPPGPTTSSSDCSATSPT